MAETQKQEHVMKREMTSNCINEQVGKVYQCLYKNKRYGIKFAYALSSGHDIIYSSDKDLTALSSFACEHWALLFHDIEYETCQKDHNIFISFAHAQVTLVNEIYDYLNKSNDVLLFCPTGTLS
ncbi:unnamed protein product [Rotaria socialis]|uniref:GH84 domain-containing protein n=1 Tax=Rotaria socialis TaxID=392032 RepID=A0A817RR48_9BILA|nr:unnamed protein product [Rotaria socialis]